MSHQEANLFFQVLSRRHDRDRPTVVTTNKPFGEWNQVFHGDSTAHVIVDRLTEQAEIFYLEGKASYRQTHRKGLNAEKPNKRTPKSWVCPTRSTDCEKANKIDPLTPSVSGRDCFVGAFQRGFSQQDRSLTPKAPCLSR